MNERIHMPVVEAFVKYVKPAKLDDLLEVVSRVSERKRASFTFSYEIRNEAAGARGHRASRATPAGTPPPPR